jgi:hypothetical protein
MVTYLPETCREVVINILRISVLLVGFICKRLYRDTRSTKHEIHVCRFVVRLNTFNTDYSDVRLTTMPRSDTWGWRFRFTILSNAEENLGFESNWKREDRERERETEREREREERTGTLSVCAAILCSILSYLKLRWVLTKRNSVVCFQQNFKTAFRYISSLCYTYR